MSGIREIDGNTPIRLCDLGAPTAMLSREQWAIACAIDGARTVQDLAWQCGLALYEAIECVGLLVQAGVCAPCARPEGPAGPLAQWFGGGAGEPRVLSPTAVLPPPHIVPDLPRHVRRAEPPGGGDFTPAQPELLRRVLDGLRRLG